MPRTRTCMECLSSVAADARRCPECGATWTGPSHRSGPWIALSVALLAVLCLGFWLWARGRPAALDVAPLPSGHAPSTADVDGAPPLMQVAPVQNSEPSAGPEPTPVPPPTPRVPAPPGETFVRTHSAGTTRGALPPNMVLVPGGDLRQGIPESALRELAGLHGVAEGELSSELGALTAMTPDHEVEVEDLLIDRHEVTNRQYEVFLHARGMEPGQDLRDLSWYYWERGEKRYGLPPGQADHPIRGVSGHEADGCARWLGKRLPTEQEWEFVARRARPANAYYPGGGGWAGWDEEVCACSRNSNQGELGIAPFPVGHFPGDVSADGVLDLWGNVGEWTRSPFVAYPGYRPIELPVRGRTQVFEASFDPEQWTIRGGSCRGNAITNNVVVRWGEHPALASEFVGFRCVASAQAGLDLLDAVGEPIAPGATRASRRQETDTRPWQSETTDGPPRLQPGSFAAQQVWVADPDAPVILQHRHLAFASTARKIDFGLEEPQLLGVLCLSHATLAPALAPGEVWLWLPPPDGGRPPPAGAPTRPWPEAPDAIELHACQAFSSATVPIVADVAPGRDRLDTTLMVTDTDPPRAELGFTVTGVDGRPLRFDAVLELPSGFLSPTPPR